MKNLSLIFTLTTALLIGFGCNKKDSTTTGYSYNTSGQCVDQNGNVVVAQLCQTSTTVSGFSCIQASNGIAVPVQYCQTTYGNSAYVCIENSTRRQVISSYCLSSGGLGTGTVIQTECSGYYIYNSSLVYCQRNQYNVNQCSGLVMTSQATQQVVQCL